MRNPKFQIFVAVFTGLLLALGFVFTLFVEDQTTLILLAVVTVLYVIYLIRVIPRLKAQRKETQSKTSPLLRK